MILRWQPDHVNTKENVLAFTVCDKPYHTNKRTFQKRGSDLSFAKVCIATAAQYTKYYLNKWTKYWHSVNVSFWACDGFTQNFLFCQTYRD